jgi:hypothetical protein
MTSTPGWASSQAQKDSARPLWEHIDRPVGADIDQHGPIDMPLAHREIVHAHHPRSPASRAPAAKGHDDRRQPTLKYPSRRP